MSKPKTPRHNPKAKPGSLQRLVRQSKLHRLKNLPAQAQRRRPRDAPIATVTARRRSLQRMVRPHILPFKQHYNLPSFISARCPPLFGNLSRKQ